MYIDLNVIQPIPSSNPNRDDTGSPKTALYGGARRHRVSSQAWKRAVRKQFAGEIPSEYLGVRTKKAIEMVAQAIIEQAPELEDKAVKLADKTFNTAGIKSELPKAKEGEEAPRIPEVKYLYFISRKQIEKIAATIVEAEREGKKLNKKQVKEILKDQNSIDLALFGRMVADDPDLNVDASCQVSHALSTHAVETEFDYFTAVDDAKDAAEEDRSAGAGMIGTVEFVSSCLYRYATINVDLLVENLDSKDDAKVAVGAFINAFVKSIPTGKINTFANHTLPSAVYVAIRDDQPMSLAGAFETPVKTDLGGGYVKKSVDQLVEYAEAIYGAYGKPVQDFACAADPSAKEIGKIAESIPLKDLAGRVAEAVFPQGD